MRTKIHAILAGLWMAMSADGQMVRSGLDFDPDDYDRIPQPEVASEELDVREFGGDLLAHRSVVLNTPDDRIQVDISVMNCATMEHDLLCDAARNYFNGLRRSKSITPSINGKVGDESFGHVTVVNFLRDNIICKIQATSNQRLAALRELGGRALRADPRSRALPSIDVWNLAKDIDEKITGEPLKDVASVVPNIERIRFSKAQLEIGGRVPGDKGRGEVDLVASDPQGGDVSVFASGPGLLVDYEEGKLSVRCEHAKNGVARLTVIAVSDSLVVQRSALDIDILDRGPIEALPSLNKEEMDELVRDIKERGLEGDAVMALYTEKARQKKAREGLLNKPTKQAGVLRRGELREVVEEGLENGKSVDEINEAISQKRSEKQGQ